MTLKSTQYCLYVCKEIIATIIMAKSLPSVYMYLDQHGLSMDFGETLEEFHISVQKSSVFSFKIYNIFIYIMAKGVWMS